MSSSIAIPRRRQPVRAQLSARSPQSVDASSSAGGYQPYSPSSSSTASSMSPGSNTTSSMEPSLKKLGKSKVMDKPVQHNQPSSRRMSLLGSSVSKSEYTVININKEGAPRLISCVKSSQGFEWNQELFLSSYVEYDATQLELRQDPVHDIILTDEEAAAILP